MISQETTDRIAQVASVCIRCRRCMQECIMLNRFAQNPKALFTQYLELGPENMDRHIAYSCNECSQCTLRCPKGLNLKAVFQSLKADYAAENQGIVPLAALLPSEAGQDRECSPDYCAQLNAADKKSGSGNAKYLFIPGKFSPEPILAHLRSSLGSGNVDLLALPVLDTLTPEAEDAIRSSPAQVLITACPSGYRSLQRALPEYRILFYWDLMHDLIGIPADSPREKTSLRLHDGIPESVQWVLDRLGCQWTAFSPEPLGDDRDCRQVLGLLFGARDTSPKNQKKEGSV